MEQKTTQQKNEDDKVVRILSKDIEGKQKLYVGLTKIKGVSWAISNAICKTLPIEKTRKIGSLAPEEIKKIEAFMKNLQIPEHLKNRKFDFETGESKHLVGSDLDLKKEFDIKRLKKIKSYRGLRHAAGLPLRGQRTRSHFRKNRSRGVGIKKKVKK